MMRKRPPCPFVWYNYTSSNQIISRSSAGNTLRHDTITQEVMMQSNITSDALAVKTCKKCQATKPLVDFYLFKSGKRAGWRNATCRACDYAQKRAWLMKQRGEPMPFIDLPLEKWRPIPGFEDRYEVSSMGRVRSWWNPQGRLAIPRLKTPTTDLDGYLQVGLYEKKAGRHYRVSRLVLIAFVGIPDEGMEASHLDGDRANNALMNLAWETRLQNEQRKIEHGTRPRGENQHSSKLTEAQVKEIRRLRQAGLSAKELADRYGVYWSTINKICRREIWKHVS